MSETLHEVVYIDKITDTEQALQVRKNLAKRFGLTARALDKLFSGKPVVVKKNVGYETADRFKRAIEEAGGVCWVQPMSADGDFEDRRAGPRRIHPDRRARERGTAIVSDRRSSAGRRSSDKPC